MSIKYIAVMSTNFLFATSFVISGWWTFSCCGGEFDNLLHVVVEVGGECSVHHILILVGRGGVHGVNSWVEVKVKVLLKFLYWRHFGH